MVFFFHFTLFTGKPLCTLELVRPENLFVLLRVFLCLLRAAVVATEKNIPEELKLVPETSAVDGLHLPLVVELVDLLGGVLDDISVVDDTLPVHLDVLLRHARQAF